MRFPAFIVLVCLGIFTSIMLAQPCFLSNDFVRGFKMFFGVVCR